MTAPRARIVIIAAVARNRVIGAADRLPWHLPGDLRHFRAETWNKPVLFGRRTWAAINKPLPGRSVIVLASHPVPHPHGCRAVVPTLWAALALAQTEAERLGSPEIMVAGGSALYGSTLALADELRLTRVEAEPIGDALFPSIDDNQWLEVSWSPPQRSLEDTAAYSFGRLHRRRR